MLGAGLARVETAIGAIDAVLTGGNANAGRVRRVGDTVRRPVGAHSHAVHTLLRHLATVGFSGAPRFLGMAPDGLEILSFVAGLTYGGLGRPSWLAAPESLRRVAQLTRRLHDATAGFVPIPLDCWQRPPPPALAGGAGAGGAGAGAAGAGGAVVCHGDLVPGNVVFEGRRPVGFIDFEFAVPADPLLDLGSLASQWAPVPANRSETGPSAAEAVQKAAAAVADGYLLDATGRQRFGDAMIWAEQRELDHLLARIAAGDAVYRAAAAAGLVAQRRYRAGWLRRHRRSINAAVVGAVSGAVGAAAPPGAWLPDAGECGLEAGDDGL
ncbi:MAG: phosphotransferase [Actinomycetota bacterium]|nr:phosphotransferase [Actinomycetota bacterium]